MGLEVNVRTVERQPIVSITRHVKVDQLDTHIRGSLDTLYALVERQGSKPTGAPFGIYHGPVNNEDDGPMEVCVPVSQTLPADGDARASELPGGKVAYVLLEGEQCNFPAILQGYDAVYDWIRANGYEPDGPPREIWLMRPGEPERMEVAWPLRE